MPSITITGVPHHGARLKGQPPPPRLEIYDFIRDKKQFSLYVQATVELKDLSQADVKSWFQISGIHGLPPDIWDGAPKKRGIGYCAHGNVLFPTWHRPYVALFEQILQARAQSIAERYTVDKKAWQAAAANLRAPYWDWAVNTLPPPEFCQVSQIGIIGQDGQTMNVPNPFLDFKFDPPLENYPGRGVKHSKTVRDNTKMIQQLNRGFEEVVAKTHRNLVDLDNWDDFSHHTADNKGAAANSLERIHDIMHGNIGASSGDMANNIVAAFDPLFWLHHCNVDRLLSLWQTLHPDVWVNDPAGKKDVNTDLIPFWNSITPASTTFHKSSSAPVQNWNDFNYTYPEFIPIFDASPKEQYKAILDVVDSLYGSKTPLVRRGGVRRGGKKVSNVPESQETYTEWRARVRTKTYGLSGSYKIYLFFGAPPNEASEWSSASNIAGTDFVFANSSPQNCANCNDQIDSFSEGIIYLTRALDRIEYGDKSVDEVRSYLIDNLQWRVQKADGTIVLDNDMTEMSVSIETVELEYSEDHNIFRLPSHNKPAHHGTFKVGQGRGG